MKHIIIAQYKEDLSWVEELDWWDVNVIKKNTKVSCLGDEFMPNRGRETYSFIKYITHNYNNLIDDDTYVFSQGAPLDHCSNFLELINTPFIGYAILGQHITACMDNGEPHHAGLPIGAFCYELFKSNVQVVAFLQGGQWMAKGGYIKSIPLAFWRKCEELHKHPLAPWVFERLWPLILSDITTKV